MINHDIVDDLDLSIIVEKSLVKADKRRDLSSTTASARGYFRTRMCYVTIMHRGTTLGRVQENAEPSLFASLMCS